VEALKLILERLSALLEVANNHPEFLQARPLIVHHYLMTMDDLTGVAIQTLERLENEQIQYPCSCIH